MDTLLEQIPPIPMHKSEKDNGAGGRGMQKLSMKIFLHCSLGTVHAAKHKRYSVFLPENGISQSILF